VRHERQIFHQAARLAWKERDKQWLQVKGDEEAQGKARTAFGLAC
jgi:hypothetical protein